MTNFFLRQPHHRGGIRQETVVIPEKMCYNPENAVQAQGGSVMPTLVPILADIRSGAEEAPPVPNTTFGMLFACWAIVIVLLAMVVVFMRAKKKDYALAVLPLTLPELHPNPCPHRSHGGAFFLSFAGLFLTRHPRETQPASVYHFLRWVYHPADLGSRLQYPVGFFSLSARQADIADNKGEKAEPAVQKAAGGL